MVDLLLVVTGNSHLWFLWRLERSHPHKAVNKCSRLLSLCQHLLSSVIFILAIPTRVRWNRKVVLICISRMSKDGEHFTGFFPLSHLYFLQFYRALLKNRFFVGFTLLYQSHSPLRPSVSTLCPCNLPPKRTKQNEQTNQTSSCGSCSVSGCVTQYTLRPDISTCKCSWQ